MVSDPTITMLPGARYRATHQASVDAILGPMGIHRKVNSFGEDFVNVDNWYIRALASNFCDWKTNNPTATSFPVKDAVALMNLSNTNKVDTPFISIAETPEQLPLNVATALIGSAYHEAWHTKYSHRDKVTQDFITNTFGPRLNLVDWGSQKKNLLYWMNLVEDVRIERVGCRDFIGARGRMEDLQDFILLKEADIFSKEPPETGSVLFGLFRDVGKAYDTELVRKVLTFYEAASPVAHFLLTSGDLKPFLDRTMSLGVGDSKECLPLAMDILIALNNLSKDMDKCQKHADGANAKAKSNIGQKDNKEEEPKPGSGDGEDGEDEEEEDKEDIEDGNSEGDDDPEEPGAPKPGKEAKGKDKTSDSSESEKKESKPKITADDFNMGAKSALKDTSGDNMLLEISKALKEAFEKLFGGEKISRNGPDIYRPMSTSFDRVINVKPSGSLPLAELHAAVRAETAYLRTRLRHLFRATELVDIEHGLRKGRHISNRMIAESVAMTRLHSRPERPFYDVSEAPDMSMAAVVVVDESASMRGTLHNTCKILLCLAESLDSIGCKTAVSGFMKSNSNEIYKMMESQDMDYDQPLYHRDNAMVYHLFKTFSERFQNVKSRFSSLTAEGDTPMGDGINFALNLLSPRNEGHRFIFVITDGQPDDHGPVRNRLQVAAKAGIKVIGVGLGPEARYVESAFPDSVWANNLAEIPAALVKKLTTTVERNEMKRGRRLSRTEESF